MPHHPILTSSTIDRRKLLLAGGSMGMLGFFPHHLQAQDSTAASPPRLALLLGNRQYPNPHDLPPVHKNIRDLSEVLRTLGFQVSTALDLDANGLKQQVTQFAQQVQAAPANAIVFFYFTGHGVQVDAENLLIGASTDPSTKHTHIVNGSLHLSRDLLQVLPIRPQGVTLAVLDACRTNLRAGQDSEGLNQVQAPPGCMIVFSTGAGKPAIAPAVETQNTFYTASLLKVLQSASQDITFSDMFYMSKSDVQQTMLNHPVSAIRQVAQFPFIASNLRVEVPLSPTATPGQPRAFTDTTEESAWDALQNSTWPADVVKAAQAYIHQFPQSSTLASATVALEGAQEAAKVVRRNDIRLFKSAFTLETSEPALREELRKAGRGDKDAAARIAYAYAQGQYALPQDDNRFQGWLQYASALGNGIAAYDLALHYRKLGQPVFASQYEALARDLGYTPPSSLDHSRK